MVVEADAEEKNTQRLSSHPTEFMLYRHIFFQKNFASATHHRRSDLMSENVYGVVQHGIGEIEVCDQANGVPAKGRYFDVVWF